ncbi:response regulator transcription factor [Nitrogeniibacter mangrovi]|uniref:Response regulator transcription factor n=1 Tax=Nitrogeniibacter mangrovi TaxID=2016596 RepID=A0A6C1B2H5_9RHOO|nr:response regulator transcription factor [Nitrogeniibacter mangrovi]QID17095.1 response regulator transcription factor [Nitrogeniibacter mangrovi]
MTSHLFISSRTRLLSRWQQAFPDARIAADTGGAPADLVWWAPAEFDLRLLERLLARVGGAAPVVVLVNAPNPAEAMQALSAGARGYCHAYATPQMLQQVAVAVQNGGLWLGPDLMSAMIGAASKQLLSDAPAPDRLDVLTPRERAVAIEVARGATNKEVARRLEITERTVKAHLGAVFEKLGVRDRLQLVLEFRDATRHVGQAA